MAANARHLEDLAMSLPAVLDLLGMAMWLVSYVLLIRVGFRDKTYAIPLIAICLNLAWEIYFAIVCPATQGAICQGIQGLPLWLIRGWLALDLIVVWQLFRHGAKWVKIPQFQRLFPLPVVVLAAITYVVVVAYMTYHGDVAGDLMAWIINVIMSLLFIEMLANREGLVGFSYAAAWTKMLASALIAAGLIVGGMQPFAGGALPYVLFATVFLFDCVYIWTLRDAILREKSRAASTPEPLPA